MRATQILALLVAGLVQTPAALADVARGPYLQQVTTDSAIVVIDVDPAAAVEVRYGTDQVVSSPAATHHELALTGLDADTRYDYAVYADGAELSSGHSLWTAVAPGQPFRMVLYGDTRSQPARHLEVVTAIEGEAANVLVTSGDLVADGEVSAQWDEFFAIESPLLSQVPMYPAVGNHDAHAGDAELLRQAFALPGNELYYSFDYGNVHVVMIDGHANAEIACRIEDQVVLSCLDEGQLTWLEADLAAAAADPVTDHIFVVTHVGPYTSVPGRLGSGQMRMLMPMFARYGVTAVLSGHDHQYERGLSDNQIPYIVSGGAGAPLYELGEPNPEPHTVLAQTQDHHYVVLDVSGATVEVTTKTPDGTVIDQAMWQARPPECTTVGCGQPEPEPEPEPEPGGGCNAGGPVAPAWILALAFALAALRRRMA